MTDKDEACIKFGQRVRNLRKDKGFSQESFADHAGIHRTYMGGIERGERNPTLTTICRLAKALDVSPSNLLETED